MWSSDRLTPRRSMEDVWRDITTSNLHHEMPTTAALSLHPHLHRPTAAATTATNTTSGGIILQDFFAGAVEAAPPPPAAGAPPRHLQNPRLATALSLNCDRANQSGTDSYYSHPHHRSGGSGSLAPASFLAREQQLHERFGVADAGADRRLKRMIKNRETAARSRARKQAYTTELELEVSHLVKENSKLKREYEELRMAMAAQASAKGTLQRTSTAPF